MRLIIHHEIYRETLNPDYIKMRRNIKQDVLRADMTEEKNTLISLGSKHSLSMMHIDLLETIYFLINIV